MTNTIIKENAVIETELVYKAYEVSHITCIIHHDYSEKILNYLNRIGLEAYVENGRTLREFINPKGFGVSRGVMLRSNQSSIIHVIVPKECTEILIESIVAEMELHLPGRGSIFCQDMMEYNVMEPVLSVAHLQRFAKKVDNVHFQTDLSYVTFVLSGHEAGERLSKIALDLGVCVPLITYGTGNDIRDQLGLIRITISPDKELVHLLIPQHDAESIIKLLAEESRLDRPGRGYIYHTPVAIGFLDTRLKVGKQSHAASIDQIIAAIDTLKRSTDWRKRLDAEVVQDSDQIFLPSDNCKISILSKEDAVGKLREVWVKSGAIGAITSQISKMNPNDGGEILSDFVISEISVPIDISDKVVSELLKTGVLDKIQLLNLPVNQGGKV